MGSVWSPDPRGSGGVARGRVESGGPRLGWVVSKCLGNRLNSSLTSSLSETGLLLAVGTAPCTYLRTSVLQAQRLIMSQQGVGADLRHWEYQRQFCSGILNCTLKYSQVLPKCLPLAAGNTTQNSDRSVPKHEVWVWIALEKLIAQSASWREHSPEALWIAALPGNQWNPRCFRSS